MIDPSDGYLNALMASKQRPQVEGELKSMRMGYPPDTFRALGEAMRWLRDRSQLQMISLLDAGCASAYYWEVLEHYVPGWVDYTGLDYNTEAIGMARSIYPGLDVFVGDISNTTFTTQRFDTVMTAATINHVKAWKAVLSELTAICRHWLVLHRLPVHDEPTIIRTTQAYDETVWDIIFNEHELAFALAEKGFVRIWLESWKDQTTQVWERQRP